MKKSEELKAKINELKKTAQNCITAKDVDGARNVMAEIENTKQYRIVFRDYRFRILTADNFCYTQDKFKISAVIDDE